MTPLDEARRDIVLGMASELLSTLSDAEITELTDNVPRRPWKSVTVGMLWAITLFSLGVSAGILMMGGG